jgi:DNA-binding protein H-NS
MPATPDASAEPYLDRVEELHDKLLVARRANAHAEHDLVEAITEAQNHGASWAHIGAAMGLRRQTAWDWYQRHLND